MATFVLVHGMFHGGWCWSGVASGLRRGGHAVFTPTLTGLGERAHLLAPAVTLETHVADLLGVIESEELHGITLVGHSFGAVPAMAVADRAPARLRRLVLLDGSFLGDGEASLDLSPPEVAAERRRLASESGGLSVAPPPPGTFGVPPGPEADWVARRMTPQPFATLEAPLRLGNPPGNGVPCIYVACTAPPYASLAYARDRARTMPGCRYVELPAGHDAMVTAPDAVTTLLESLP